MEIFEAIQKESREVYKDKENPLQILPMVEYLGNKGISTQADFQTKANPSVIGEMLKTLPTNFDLNLGIDLLAIKETDYELLHKKWEQLNPDEQARLNGYTLVKGRTAEQLVKEYQFVRERIGRYLYFMEQRGELQEEVATGGKQNPWEQLKGTVSKNWDKLSGTEKMVAVAALIVTAAVTLLADKKEHSVLAGIGSTLKWGTILGVGAHLGSKLFTGKGIMDNIFDSTAVTDKTYWEKTLDTTPEKAESFNHFFVEAADADVPYVKVYDEFMRVKRAPSKEEEKEIDTAALGMPDFDGREAYIGLSVVFKKFDKEFDAAYKDPATKQKDREFAAIWALIMTESPRFKADLEESFNASLADRALNKGKELAGDAKDALDNAIGWTKTTGGPAVLTFMKDFMRDIPSEDLANSKLWKTCKTKADLEAHITANYADKAFANLVNSPNTTHELPPPPAGGKGIMVLTAAQVPVTTEGDLEDRIPKAIQAAYDQGLKTFEDKGYKDFETLEVAGGAYLEDSHTYQLYMKVYLPGSLVQTRGMTRGHPTP